MLRHLLARFGQRTAVRFSSLACRSLPDKKLPSYKLLMAAFPLYFVTSSRASVNVRLYVFPRLLSVSLSNEKPSHHKQFIACNQRIC